MRNYTIQPQDSLEAIIRRYYDVGAAPGPAQDKRIARVHAQIEKKYPEVSAHPGRHAGQVIELPSVFGIPERDPLKRVGYARNWRYAAFWLVPILLGTLFALTEKHWYDVLLSWPNDPTFGWLAPVFQYLASAADALFSSGLKWIVLWSLFVFWLWLYYHPFTGPKYFRRRFQYLMGWAIGLAMLLLWTNTIIGAVLSPPAASQLWQFTQLVPLATIWTTAVFLIFLYRGDSSEGHRLYLARYQAVWTVLALVLLTTVLTGYSTYQGVQARVAGDMSDRSLLRTTVLQLQDSAHSARIKVEDFATALDSYEQTSLAKQADPSAAPDPQAAAADDARSAIFNLQPLLPALEEAVTNAHTRAQAALNQVNSQQVARGSPLGQITDVLTETVRATDSLYRVFLILETQMQQEPRPGLLTDLSRTMHEGLIGAAQDAETRTTLAANSIVGTDVSGLALFLWLVVFYSVLVLFPWVLLMLFLYRKRTNLAGRILEDLEYLDATGGLLKRVLGLSEAVTSAGTTQQTANPASASPKGTAARPGLPLPRSSTHYREQEREDLLTAVDECTKNLNDPTGRKPVPIRTLDTVLNALANQAFSNFEYVLSLLVLTVMTAVGWYYVFYPQYSIGLADLIETNGGIRQLADRIVGNLTPLTMGFAGAYFFLLQLLVRRYLADDLYPAAFLLGAQRLLLAFILSLALSVLTPLVYLPTDWASDLKYTLISLGAFFAGVLPAWAVAYLARQVGRLFRSRIDGLVEKAPLTELDGMNIWADTRLAEERIENIQSLATASIEQLVVGTRFTAAQLVDWIDQAILYMHAKEDAFWLVQLRAIGIRTATDLLYALGLNPLKPGQIAGPESVTTARPLPDEHRLNDVVAAINDSRVWLSAAASRHLEDTTVGVSSRNGHENNGHEDKVPAAVVAQAGATDPAKDATPPAGGAANPDAPGAGSPAKEGASEKGAAPVQIGTTPAAAAAQTAAAPAPAAAAPVPLTANIVREIYYAIWPDPNIQYVLSYYERTGKTWAPLIPKAAATQSEQKVSS